MNQKSNIEQIIRKIEEYIKEDCKYHLSSNTKIIADKEYLGDLLRCLRRATQNNREEILTCLNEIGNYIESCRFCLFSTKKIIINKEHLIYLLNKMKTYYYAGEIQEQ